MENTEQNTEQNKLKAVPAPVPAPVKLIPASVPKLAPAVAPALAPAPVAAEYPQQPTVGKAVLREELPTPEPFDHDKYESERFVARIDKVGLVPPIEAERVTPEGVCPHCGARMLTEKSDFVATAPAAHGG